MTYRIGVGDELEILYHIDPGATVTEYVIDTEDKLRVDFYFYPVMSKTVQVRPDGFVTLPRIGDVKVGGKKPADIARDLKKLYEPHLARPLITVEVLEFNVKIEELKRAIYNQQRGMSRLAVVRPDGKISLPYIGDVDAFGSTAPDLRTNLEGKYAKLIRGLGITVMVLNAKANRVYVMGEVKNPNYYELTGPTSLSQLIATAGGFTVAAKSNQLVIIRRSAEGTPTADIINVGEIFGEDVVSDPLLQQHDVIYVPRTALAKAALTWDFIWRIIPLGISLDYQLGGIAVE